MQRKIRHIQAGPTEWIRVHRNEGHRPRGGSWGWVGLVALIAVLWIAWEILKWLVGLFLAILPYLLVAAGIAAVVYVWANLKRKN